MNKKETIVERMVCKNSLCPRAAECDRKVSVSLPLTDHYQVVCDGRPRIEPCTDMHGEFVEDEQSEASEIISDVE